MGDFWTELTTLPAAADTFSLPALLFFALFAIGFVVSVVLVNQGARRLTNHPVTRRAIQHCANIGMYLFGAGVFFFGVRALNINPFSFGAPLWMWLCVVGVLVFAGYCLRYWRTTYPANIRAYDERQLKQRYLRPAREQHRRPPTPASARPATNAAASRDKPKRGERS